MLYAIILCFQVLTGSEYNRADYVKQSAWMKTRNIVLSAYLAQGNGTIKCKYTGVAQDPHDLDIDHIVPAKYAHAHGLSDSSVALKRTFGMDTANMVPVSAHVNRSKGDDGPALFMPELNSCWYANKWLEITRKYKITMTKEDKHVIDSTHKACKEHK